MGLWERITRFWWKEAKHIHLRRGNGKGDGHPVVARDQRPAIPVAAPLRQPAAHDPALTPVRAPLLGTYYRAPKPGAPPFVEAGASVEPDTVIGIIEVMKLMNAVRAGTRGVVREIRARDGTLVEYGEILLLVDARGSG